MVQEHGEYELSEDPEKYQPQPFGPKAFGIVIEAAIENNNLYADD